MVNELSIRFPYKLLYSEEKIVFLKYQVFEHFQISLYSSQGLEILQSLKMTTAL